MDKLSAHQKSPMEEAKAKKKQIKVVYISNPMRVKTSAAEFKGLVQELTGQNSDVADFSKFMTNMEQAEQSPAAADRGSGSTDDDSGACRMGVAGAEEPDHHCDPYMSVTPPFEMFDDELFTPQVLEDLAAFMPSSILCESPPPVDSCKRLDVA